MNSKEEVLNNSEINLKKKFENLIESYLNYENKIYSGKKTEKVSELEIRFNKGYKKITKIDYDNTIKKLFSMGFKCENMKGIHMLRIYNEYYNTKINKTVISRTRTEIIGVELIQEYCNTNNIQTLIEKPYSTGKIKMTEKTNANNIETSQPIMPIIFNDLNFKIAYQLEGNYSLNTDLSKDIIRSWPDKKKVFRHINRVRFTHDKFPIFVDLSIIKTSKTISQHNDKKKEIMIPKYTIQEAEVFQNEPTYEIELEVDNKNIGLSTEYNTTKSLITVIKKCIRIILSALQDTNYPIGNNETNNILKHYISLIHKEDETYKEKKYVYSSDFIGPSSYTLQLENIIYEKELETNSTKTIVPNIRKNYTVTDKADGERKLLYISENGRIYMIDTNMNVIFTGMITENIKILNSLLDGEHIKYNKNGEYINTFASFDIYFIHNKSVREYAFYTTEDTLEEKIKSRLYLLNQLISQINLKSVVDIETVPIVSQNRKISLFNIKCKEFQIGFSNDPYDEKKEDNTIFNACYRILSRINDGFYEYNTDGLIFTPSNTGVGSNVIGSAGPLYKITWEYSLKWKPPQYNTIDFLVSIKKDKNGQDEIGIFSQGNDGKRDTDLIQYKTLILRCGYDEEKHGYLNPSQDIYDDKNNTLKILDENGSSSVAGKKNKTYKPVPFQPTNPYDPNACFCNVILNKSLSQSEGNKLYMKTEEGEYFEEDMIVEFKYDLTKEGFWRWVPLRVRYDKTTELRAGLENYGNAYHVANSNWSSIHNPITEEMITSGLNIPNDIEIIENSDVYYNRTIYNESNTRSLRDFHNLYVKKKIISTVSKRGDTLIDYAVGKGGDLNKWIDAKLYFVLGIDISKDNIHNRLDGACARYLNTCKKYTNIPSVLFIHGNSSQLIRSTDAFYTTKEKQIINSVFANEPKNIDLGKGVYKRYGIGKEGFNISSCQFALHYFFENIVSLNNFVRNLAECTKLNGYFIGTTFDGTTIFNLLKELNQNESITINKNNYKIFEITKQYSQSGFHDDELSLGYAIDVYQETINKVFREYLVNFNYFIRIMDNYGFVLSENKELKSTGLFSELFNKMENEIKQNKTVDFYKSGMNMTDEEKQISFLNRYFIFQKTREVNTNNVSKVILKKHLDETEIIGEEKIEKTEKTEKTEIYTIKPKIVKIKKINKKFIIDKYSPVKDDNYNETQSIIPVENADINNTIHEKKIIIKRPKK
jgi:hypothetical protein